MSVCRCCYSLVVILRTARFNIHKFYVLPTQCIYVFCVDLRTNSDYFPYRINWLVCITETECVYCAVRTEHLTVNNSTFCPHTIFMCFMWIWEQTAIISLYSIDWLVFIPDTECVYCAVRTGYIHLYTYPYDLVLAAKLALAIIT